MAEQDLAALLSAALRHPELPAAIHNDIMDNLNDLMCDGINTASPEFIRAVLDRHPARAGDRQAGNQPSGGVLARIKKALSDGSDLYRPITHAHAEELTDTILSFDDDETTWAFVRLLHGIVHAYYEDKRSGRGDVEGLAMYAAHRGYAKTVHFQEGFHEFAKLDPDNADDLRVLRRQFRNEKDGETEQDRSE